jgi:hypothetical protein
LYNQITQDLLPFVTHGITEANLNRTRPWCETYPSHYICLAIINGTVHLTTLPWRDAHIGEILSIVAFLLELYETSLKYRLPDVEFAIATGDLPLYKLSEGEKFGTDEPVLLSYSKTANSPDILVPGAQGFR